MKLTNCPSCGEALPRVVDAFCPHCRESLSPEEDLAPTNLTPAARDTSVGSHGSAEAMAIRMIRDGATPGMIRAQLRKQGLDDDECNAVIKKSMSSSANQARFKGIGWFVAGGAILVFGLGLMGYEIVNEASSVYVPIGIIVFGFGLLAKGFITALTGIDNG